jgi:hypothetical protein
MAVLQASHQSTKKGYGLLSQWMTETQHNITVSPLTHLAPAFVTCIDMVCAPRREAACCTQSRYQVYAELERWARRRHHGEPKECQHGMLVQRNGLDIIRTGAETRRGISLSKTWKKKKEGIERQSNKKESDARYQKQTRSQEYRKKTQAPTRPATDTTGGQLVNGTRTHHLLNPLIPNLLLICLLCLVLHFLLAHPIIISQLTNK